jgi:vacuolar-type H+-ATPase subunit B/Vma2
MLIEFAQVVFKGMAAAESVVRTNSKEWQEQEALRRKKMTEQERHDEDIAKLLRRMR